MLVLNDSGMEVGWLVGHLRPHRISATLIAKGTFHVVHGKAAVLADELCRADSRYITHAFETYMTRRRARVNKVQDQSRMMGKVAYANSRVVSFLRNCILKLYSNKIHMKYWDSMLKEPI